MARRKHELLNDAEREQLIGIPRDRDHLARLYTFEPNDFDIIGERRGKGNLLGLRGPVRGDIPLMIEAAARAAGPTDKSISIGGGVITCLRNAGIVFPSISAIERASIAGRARTRKQAAEALVSSLTADQLLALNRLFDHADGEGISRLTWLKAIPHAVKPDHIRQILERLKFVRQIGIPAEFASAIHIDRYRQFVREGRVSATYMIERYTKARRHATLVAFLIDIEERLTDSALEMADKLIGSVFTRAKNAQARSFAGTARDVSRLMQVFRRTIDALTAAVENDEDPIEALDASVGWFTLLKIRHEVASIADTAHVDPLIVAADRYLPRSAGQHHQRPPSPAVLAGLGFGNHVELRRSVLPGCQARRIGRRHQANLARHPKRVLVSNIGRRSSSL